MNLIPYAPTWLIGLLFVALAAAAIEDFVRLKISNITCTAVLITALIAMGFAGFPIALWQNGLVFLVLLGAGSLLFAAGKMGGGDVKLLACLGLWVNITVGVWLLATTLLAGGVLAVIYIIAWRLRGVGRKSSKGIPYGLAIVAGASLIFAGQLGFMKPTPERPNPLAMQPLG